jgi:hypothetical protein
MPGAGDVRIAATSDAPVSPIVAGASELRAKAEEAIARMGGAVFPFPIKASISPDGKVSISSSGNGPDGQNGLNGQGTDSVREILKPGYRTTEFWLVAWIVGLTLLDSLFGQLPASRATLLSACIGGGYSLCRSGLKALRYIQSADADQTRAAMESESAHREHQLALEKLK